MEAQSFRLLLPGHDTIECAYYLGARANCTFDYARLAVEKELLRASKSRRPTLIRFGSEEFLLASHGTGSGYPFLLENGLFSIQCGEFNKPSFFVTYRSFALWQYGAQRMHERFLAWAASVGLMAYQPERLRRVDFTFDYYLPAIDFDEDCFVSAADKDNQHRKNRKVQTFSFGAGDVMLRLYNKVDEIAESSAKTWFFDLWGIEEDVWRIEWQVIKPWLRRFGIKTFADLLERQGDLLRILVNEHTTLRVPNGDSNRSRWPLHPLWADLIERVNALDGLGIVRECDPQALLDERLMRLGVSVYGYMKRLAAIHGLQRGYGEVGLEETKERLGRLLNRVHDPLSWEGDVQRRMDEMRLGQW